MEKYRGIFTVPDPLQTAKKQPAFIPKGGLLWFLLNAPVRQRYSKIHTGLNVNQLLFQRLIGIRVIRQKIAVLPVSSALKADNLLRGDMKLHRLLSVEEAHTGTAAGRPLKPGLTGIISLQLQVVESPYQPVCGLRLHLPGRIPHLFPKDRDHRHAIRLFKRVQTLPVQMEERLYRFFCRYAGAAETFRLRRRRLRTLACCFRRCGCIFTGASGREAETGRQPQRTKNSSVFTQPSHPFIINEFIFTRFNSRFVFDSIISCTICEPFHPTGTAYYQTENDRFH